jgi:hypothetical protein
MEPNQTQLSQVRSRPSGLSVIPTFAAFLPEFSGFASSGWAALISGPRRRAAESRELTEMNDHVLDASDFLGIFDETADEVQQRSEIAKSFFEIFRIHLMSAHHGIGNDLEFHGYDAEADRVVALVPLPTIMRIVEICARGRHGAVEGALPEDFAPLRSFIPWDDRRAEQVVRHLRSLDRSALGELLRAVSTPGLERSAMTAIGQLADDILERSVDWQKFWTAVEKRYRTKHLSDATEIVRGP